MASGSNAFVGGCPVTSVRAGAARSGSPSAAISPMRGAVEPDESPPKQIDAHGAPPGPVHFEDAAAARRRA